MMHDILIEIGPAGQESWFFTNLLHFTSEEIFESSQQSMRILNSAGFCDRAQCAAPQA